MSKLKKIPVAVSGASERESIQERIVFYQDLAKKNGLVQGEPVNKGSNLHSFFSAVFEDAKDFKDHGLVPFPKHNKK